MLDALLAHLRDMDHPVVFESDVYEGSEVGDVADDTGDDASLSEIFDLGESLFEGDGGELFAGVEAGFGELFDDVFEGGFAYVELLGYALGIAQVVVAGESFGDGVAFGVDAGVVKEAFAVAYADEPCGLLVGFGSETFDVEEGFF